MKNEQALALAAAFDTNTMGGLKVQAKSVADYLQFDATKIDNVLHYEPGVVASGHSWKVPGDDQPAVMGVSLSDAGRTLTWHAVEGSEGSVAVAAMGELYWAANNGVEVMRVGAEVFEKVPKLDKFRCSPWVVGWRRTPWSVDAAALNNARKIIGKNALPVLLGGDKLPYSIVDELGAIASDVVGAAHTELVSAVGVKQSATFAVGEHTVSTAFSKSGGSLYWSDIEKGSSSVGAARAASAAQLRSFVNAMADRRGAPPPGGRRGRPPRGADAARRAEEVRSQGDSGLGQERRVHAARPGEGHEDAGRARQGAGRSDRRNSAGSTYIEQQAALIKWPTVEDLTPTSAAKLSGQTPKALFKDAEGNEWLFKPGASGRGAATDKAAADLAMLLGLPIPPVRVYTLEVNGKMVQGSLQKMVPNSKGITSLDELSPAQMDEMMRHSVLDWVVNNDDAHIGNWLVDDRGQLWSIDKSRGWQTFHDGSHDVLNTASNGNGGGKPLIFDVLGEGAARSDDARQARPERRGADVAPAARDQR